MRNHYETEIGHFKNAITPDVDTFRDSLPIIEEDLSPHKDDKNLVMYCTGGIRCEKASILSTKVLKCISVRGGIINYTKQVEQENLENKFIGKNFVLITDVAKEFLEVIAQCIGGAPCDTHTNCANEACHLLFIQCETCKAKMNNCCSDACKEVNDLSLEEQKAETRKKASNKIFKKGSEALKFKKI